MELKPCPCARCGILPRRQLIDRRSILKMMIIKTECPECGDGVISGVEVDPKTNSVPFEIMEKLWEDNTSAWGAANMKKED